MYNAEIILQVIKNNIKFTFSVDDTTMAIFN